MKGEGKGEEEGGKLERGVRSKDWVDGIFVDSGLRGGSSNAVKTLLESVF